MSETRFFSINHFPVIVANSKRNNRHFKRSIVSHLYHTTAKARCYVQLKGGCNRITLPLCTHCTHCLCRYCRELVSNSYLHDHGRQLHELLQSEAPRTRETIPSCTDALIHEFRNVDVVTLAETINVAVNTEK